MSDPFASEIPTTEATFAISESARKQLLQIFAQEADPNTMLRVKVSGGGCAGYQYGFDFENTISEDDSVFGDDEVKDRAVSIRSRSGNQRNGVPLEEFVADIFAEISNRSGHLSIVE